LRWRDSDQCPWYDGPNPLFYAIWVCPCCHYAAYREEFGLSPTGKAKDAVNEALAAGAPSASALAFDGGERSLFAALTSFQLALTCYEARKAPPEVLAGLAMRAAWICRFAEEIRREVGFLAKARDLYIEAFERGARRDATLDDLSIAYLIGEMLLRTGRIGEAFQYFRLVVEAKDSSTVLAATARERQGDAMRSQKVREFLDKVQMFSPLGDRGLSLLAVHAVEQTFKPGAAIVHRGKPGEAMYVLMSGEVKLFASDEAEGDPIATLTPGETFGEMALFTGEPHRELALAWVPGRGNDRVVLLEIRKSVFRNLVKAVPDVALRVAVAMSRRYARCVDDLSRAETLTV
jgi:uncharacterized protein (DUF2225 family)